MDIKIEHIWTASGFLIALQIGAFTWRINREIKISEKKDINWLPWADIINLLSLLTAFLGVFVLPLLGLESSKIPRIALGLSIILFAGYPFALAGHYELFTKGGRSMVYFPGQEKVAVFITLGTAILFLLLSFFLVPSF
jgi:hypothetical protein